MATPRRLISLTQAAEDLGVHYMTAYRYVRTGRLPAQKSGHEWLVDEADVLAMREPEPTPGPRRGRRADYPRRLEDRLLAADETGAWTVVEQALGSGMEPADLYLEVLAPAMASVGERWANGEIPVSSEHRASATALRLIGRLGPRFARRGRKRGTVIVGAPPGDAHALPSAIARDLLRGRSYAVIDLGSDVPAEDWALLADTTEGLTTVGLCVTTTGNDANVRAAVAAIHAAADVPVILGGAGVSDAEACRRLGGDLYSATATQLLDLVDDVAGGRAA